MFRISALLAAWLLAGPALSAPPTQPVVPGLPAAAGGWVAVPVAVMTNGQLVMQWALVPAQAVPGLVAAAQAAMPAPPAKSAATAATAAAPAPKSAPLSAPVAASASATHARVLAATCAACHGTDGRSHSAMPGLAGLPAPYLVQQMQDFKSGKRDATVMHQHAKGYTDEEIQHMADLFAATKP